MTIVAWICALFGGVLALAMSAGSAAGVVRRMDLSSALTVVPLPALAVYFSAPDTWAAIREKAEPGQRRPAHHPRVRRVTAPGAAGC